MSDYSACVYMCVYARTSLNVHLPVHYPQVVAALGPLVRYWAFGTERLNRRVKVNLRVRTCRA